MKNSLILILVHKNKNHWLLGVSISLNTSELQQTWYLFDIVSCLINLRVDTDLTTPLGDKQQRKRHPVLRQQWRLTNTFVPLKYDVCKMNLLY